MTAEQTASSVEARPAKRLRVEASAPQAVSSPDDADASSPSSKDLLSNSSSSSSSSSDNVGSRARRSRNILPLGNAIGVQSGSGWTYAKQQAGLGVFAIFPADRLQDLLLDIAGAVADLEQDAGPSADGGRTGSRALLRLARLSRIMRAHVMQESLWKRHFERQARALHPEHKRARIERWYGSWRDTLIAQEELAGDASAIEEVILKPRRIRRELRRAGQLHEPAKVFSDELYHEIMFNTFPLDRFASVAASKAHGFSQKKRNRKATAFTPIPRVDPTALSHEEFYAEFCEANQPCIIAAQGTERWPCRSWTLSSLADRFDAGSSAEAGTERHRLFNAEEFEASMSTYRDYSRSATLFEHVLNDSDEPYPPETSKLLRAGCEAGWYDEENTADLARTYLFDSSFASDPRVSHEWRVPSLLATVPSSTRAGTSSSSGDHASTSADLFRLFGDRRPDHRWIIAGPARSGSGWHKDPNMTSAWNAIMSGRKLWLMLPPDTCPPGVFVDADEAEVTQPVSIAEWVHEFYAEARAKHGPKEVGGDGKLLEGICGPGETVYVPSGWWHLVINLEGELG